MTPAQAPGAADAGPVRAPETPPPGARRRAARLGRAAIRMEVAVWRSLALVLARRRPGQGPGVQVVPYARDLAPLLWAFVGVSAVEVPVFHLLLPWEPVRLAVLVVGVWGLLWMLGLLASVKVFPHLLTPDGLRVRYGATVDVRIPWSAVRDVQARRGSFPNSRTVQTTADEDGTTVAIAVLKQTKVDVRLAHPVTVDLPDGPVEITTLRFHADRPRDVVVAARSMLESRAAAAAGS